MSICFRQVIAIALLGSLLSCQADRQIAPPVVIPPIDPALPELTEEDIEAAFREELRQQLYIADMLYDGLRALAADRLMTPAEGSALSIFNRVLSLQPGNTVALQGIEDIAGRYLELAAEASRQGEFANAGLYLQRAETVFPDHAGLDATRQSLELERERTHSVHRIDSAQLRVRSPALVSQLHSLARQAREQMLLVVITVPADAQGRWIYSQMQEAAGEQRLRASIEIGEQSAVRLLHPLSD